MLLLCMGGGCEGCSSPFEQAGVLVENSNAHLSLCTCVGVQARLKQLSPPLLQPCRAEGTHRREEDGILD